MLKPTGSSTLFTRLIPVTADGFRYIGKETDRRWEQVNPRGRLTPYRSGLTLSLDNQPARVPGKAVQIGHGPATVIGRRCWSARTPTGLARGRGRTGKGCSSRSFVRKFRDKAGRRCPGRNAAAPEFCSLRFRVLGRGARKAVSQDTCPSRCSLTLFARKGAALSPILSRGAFLLADEHGCWTRACPDSAGCVG